MTTSTTIPSETLFREEPYSIRRHGGIPPAALDFLDSIAWGNEGAVYAHMNTEEHIGQLHNPSLISIHEEEAIRGTAVFSNTPVTVDGRPFNCHYIRYFASSPLIRGKGVMKRFSRKVMELIREGEEEPTIYFACIERGNRASYRVVESAGYRPIGDVKTLGFSRFFPKTSDHVVRLAAGPDREEILELLRQQYQPHALVQFNSLFLHDDYFAIRENGELVAGCQLHRVHWVVNRMKGLTGKLIMTLVPRIPLLNQIFNPQRFEFLAFEGIYVRPGHEHRLFELFEHLLAQEGLKSAMFWLGADCPVRERIQAAGSLGLIHGFVKDSDVTILADFQNCTADDIALLQRQPLFASAFDYI